jgi:hypothetical protein
MVILGETMRSKNFITGYARGAIQLRFLDVVTVVVLTGILAWVASMQFATYDHAPATAASPAAAATASPAKAP